jgi:hypothetical protein
MSARYAPPYRRGRVTASHPQSSTSEQVLRCSASAPGKPAPNPCSPAKVHHTGIHRRFHAIHTSCCAVSAPMCRIAHAVLHSNRCPTTAVQIINKYSTALSLQQPNADIQSPLHIIVTETADAGLLGEYMLPALLHAARTLATAHFPPPSSAHPARKPTFIPAAAVVYAALVDDASLLLMSRAQLFSAQLRPDEAYSCGRLPASASLLTPSFVGKRCIAGICVMFASQRASNVSLFAAADIVFGEDIVGKQHRVSLFPRF